MFKFLSVIFASIFAFFLFVGMTLLIEPNQAKAVPTQKTPPVNIHYEEKDDEVQLTVRRFPDKPKELEQPKIVKTTIDTNKDSNQIASIDFRLLDISSSQIGNFGLPNLMGRTASGSSVPRVRINPTYPRVAALEGIEGYVTLSFDISPSGSTENIRVVDSQPRNMFEQNARKALRKWKFSPNLKNNKPVVIKDQTITLQFRLEEDML